MFLNEHLYFDERPIQLKSHLLNTEAITKSMTASIVSNLSNTKVKLSILQHPQLEVIITAWAKQYVDGARHLDSRLSANPFGIFETRKENNRFQQVAKPRRLASSAIKHMASHKLWLNDHNKLLAKVKLFNKQSVLYFARSWYCISTAIVSWQIDNYSL